MELDPKFHNERAKSMEYRRLGKTDMKVSKIGIGAASFGNLYGSMTQETVNEIVLKALQSGINFIDTAPWYGQGVSEERLGIALKNVPRDKYFIATKVGRYIWEPRNLMFDFSVAKVEQSFKESLQKLQLPYVDLIQVHDVDQTASINQIVKYTLPALKRLKDQGLARYIGITAYNLGVLKKIVRLSPPGTIDTILSYARCNLINQDLLDELDFYEKNGIGVINASPLCMGLLNNEASPPEWHLAPGITQDFVKKAAELCKKRNADLALCGMHFCLNQEERVATCLSSMIDDDQLSKNLKCASTSCEDPKLMTELKAIFDDLPVSHWETLEVEQYWPCMKANGWKQNLD